MFALLLRAAPWLMKATPLVGLLKTRGKAVVAVLSVLSILGAGVYVNVLKNKIERLEVRSALVEAQLIESQSVNGKNLSTIHSLQAANESLATAIEVTDEERIKAITEAAERGAQAAAELNSSLTELERLRNANPTCEQLSNIDIGAACPLVIERLREHAAGTIGRD